MEKFERIGMSRRRLEIREADCANCILAKTKSSFGVADFNETGYPALKKRQKESELQEQ
jgi:hypothetical protein